MQNYQDTTNDTTYQETNESPNTYLRKCGMCVHIKVCSIYADFSRAMMGKPNYSFNNPIIDLDNIALICQMYKEDPKAKDNKDIKEDKATQNKSCNCG